MSFSGRKFGRVCQLSVELAPDSTGKARNLTIPPAGQALNETTIEFTINRQSFSASQTAQFRVYNLDEQTRDAIFKDQFDWTQFRAVQFRAGFDTFMPRIFNGTVLSAYSEKDGENVVTVIDAFDGGFPMTNGWTNVPTNSSKRPASEAINQLAAGMPGTLGPPVVGDFPVANMRGQVLFGNTWGLIQELSGNQATISDGIIYVLNPNEGILAGQIADVTKVPNSTSIPLITSETGLLGAPRRTGLMVEWDMLFEPRLNLFQIVSIQSDFNPKFNGVHKVMGIRHRGIVSKAVNGEYLTTAKFFWGSGSLFDQAVQQSIAP